MYGANREFCKRERIEAKISQEIKSTICEIPGIEGAYDLTLNNYGPNLLIGSVHIAIPDTWTADKIDHVTRQIQSIIQEKYNILIQAVGIYSVNTKDNMAKNIRLEIAKILTDYPLVLQVHGFYFNLENKVINFDIIIDFKAPDRISLFKEIYSNIQKAFPDYTVNIQLDADFSD